MIRKGLISAAAIAAVLVPSAAMARHDGYSLEQPAQTATAGLTQKKLVRALNTGDLSVRQARQLGLLVFSTPFNHLDGLGDGPWRPDETDPVALGQRPTLQGNGQFLRVNGLDSQSCNECHSVVSSRTLPPTTGIAGVGGAVQNAIIMPSVIDVADSFDDRVQFVSGHDPSLPMVFDGVADYNGRFANPPFLYGGGGTELLGKEMTEDLQHDLQVAKASPAGTVVSLDTHGVNFGTITSLGGGNVQIDNQGVDSDLVVKPFGRKGDAFSMRDFDRGAMQFHFGIQPDEVVGKGVDADHDGVADEVTDAEMSVLHIFDVNNPVPRYVPFDSSASHGFQVFQQVGCSDCHKPALVTRSRLLPLAFPEVKTDPTANVYYNVDLTNVGFQADPNGPGVIVPFFADLKRHDMGPGLAETFERGKELNPYFTTARLWGIADTAPYMHDGRATTLYQAIMMHGGEAQQTRDNFANLSNSDQHALISFLKSLRVPEHPDEDLLPIQ